MVNFLILNHFSILIVNLKICKPILVLGLIKFSSIIFLDAISKTKDFLLEYSCINFKVLSPIDRFGLLTILSKAKSSFVDELILDKQHNL